MLRSTYFSQNYASKIRQGLEEEGKEREGRGQGIVDIHKKILLVKSHDCHMTTPAIVPHTCQRRAPSRVTVPEWTNPPPSCTHQCHDLQDKCNHDYYSTCRSCVLTCRSYGNMRYPSIPSTITHTHTHTHTLHTCHTGNPLGNFIMTELQVLSNIVNNLGTIVGCSLAPAVKYDVDARLLTGCS